MTRLLKHPIPQGTPSHIRAKILAELKPPDDYNKGDCMWCRNHNVHKVCCHTCVAKICFVIDMPVFVLERLCKKSYFKIYHEECLECNQT